MKSKFLLPGTLVLLLVASCTEAFKHKMEVANKYLGDMNAKSVICGTATETTNGKSITMTTLKFEGCANTTEGIERERITNQVAVDFYGEMKPEELEGETHLKISAETKDNTQFEYLFDLESLKSVGEYQKITDQMFEACIAQDTAAIRDLKDNSMMPDEQMGSIYEVLAYNDSIYQGDNPVKEFIGFRLTNGVEDPDLQLYSANYMHNGKDWHTMYTININRKTKKVVYIWVKSDPK